MAEDSIEPIWQKLHEAKRQVEAELDQHDPYEPPRYPPFRGRLIKEPTHVPPNPQSRLKAQSQSLNRQIDSIDRMQRHRLLTHLGLGRYVKNLGKAPCSLLRSAVVQLEYLGELPRNTAPGWIDYEEIINEIKRRCTPGGYEYKPPLVMLRTVPR